MAAENASVHPYNVLILGEALMERWGRAADGRVKFRGYSAGSLPKGQAHTAALATVIGVLVEVPVMLSVVAIVERTRGWYGRGQGPSG